MPIYDIYRKAVFQMKITATLLMLLALFSSNALTVTGQPKGTLKGHTGGINCIAFSPEGGTLASGSWDGTVQLWDAVTGMHKQTLIDDTVK